MALTLIPVAHLSIGVMGVLLFGSEEQKRRYLPRAASGEMIFVYALTESRTRGTYITNANYAGAFSVFAGIDAGGMGMFIIERGWDGVTVGPDMPKMGRAVNSTASVRLKAVQVPRENLVGEAGDGFKIVMTVLNYGRLGLGLLPRGSSPGTPA
jgi:acyl-CoA dehydrogenase family protein 9